jgi:poly-gamma-glutamate capsule biosynthesis protein CapA/YwtB (metallophosphatase superfamily)
MRRAALLALALSLIASPAAEAKRRGDKTTKTAKAAKKKAKKKKADPPAAAVVPIPRSDEPLDDLAPPELPEGTISIAAVGDIMLGSTYPDETGGDLPPDDGANLLAEVTPILGAADVTFGNLEGPMIDGGESSKCGPKKSKKCWAYRVPTRYGAYLKAAGFDVLSLANNHAMDFGDEGRQSSKKVLDELGIAHSGEVGTVARLEADGKTIEVIAFATYEHSNDLNDLEAATALVKESASRADIVVVSFHGGAEGKSRQRVPVGAELFYSENRGDLRVFTHAMIDAGADLVLGHGPHVIRGVEIYKDRLIAYSLGNFATYGGFNLSGVSGLTYILEAHLAPDGTFLAGKAHPVKQRWPGGPLLDSTSEVLPLLRDLSDLDFPTSSIRVGKDGTLLPPETVEAKVDRKKR